MQTPFFLNVSNPRLPNAVNARYSTRIHHSMFSIVFTKMCSYPQCVLQKEYPGTEMSLIVQGQYAVPLTRNFPFPQLFNFAPAIPSSLQYPVHEKGISQQSSARRQLNFGNFSRGR